MRTTLCILLIIGLALGLAAKPTAPKNEDKDDTDVDIDAPLTDEEEAILERLVNDGVIKEEDLVDTQSDDVEVELAPAEETVKSAETNKKSSASVVKGEMKEQQMVEEPFEDDEAEEPVKEEAAKPTTPEDERAKKAAKMSAEGEREFMTFTDPEYSARAMRDTPTVDVKRSRELHFTDDNSAGITKANMIFIGIVGVCAVVAMMGTVVAGVAYYKLHKQHIAVQRGQQDYATRERRHISAHGLDKRATRTGDAKNAYSAQLHHYQQTKSEIIRIQQAEAQAHDHESDESDAEDNEEPDYSVYECPGLAPTGDIEVANPMFDATQKR